MHPEPDFEAISCALRWLCPYRGAVFEVRSLDAYTQKVHRGYFNDPIIAANAIVQMDNANIGAFYSTLNPVQPDLIARCANRMQWAKGSVSTKDSEILEYRHFVIDFDAKRGSGISATDAEHEAVLIHAKVVTDILTREFGFPTPCLIDSGNGVHARYSFHAPNSEEIKAIYRACLLALAKAFDTAEVEIDTSVYSPGQILRIPGTVARKGEHMPDLNRLHRTSRILQDYDPWHDLKLSAVQAVIDRYGVSVPAPADAKRRAVIEYPVDELRYKALNETAKQRPHDWVPDMLGHIARPYGDGYRIKSEDVGRDLQEEISIRVGCIKDFGVHDLGDETEGRRTPISLVAELLTNGNKKEAAERLALILNVPVDEFTGKLLAPLPPADKPVTMPPDLMGGHSSELAEIKHFGRIMDKEIKQVDYLVHRLLVLNTHTVLSGPAKMGKSTLAYDLALHVIFGRPFLGRPTKRAKVLYLALEEREHRFHRKMMVQFNKLMEDSWGPISAEEQKEAFSRLFFYTLDSKHQDGKETRLPVGHEGAAELKRIMRDDNSEDWLIIIEPVILFHQEGSTRNLNKLEYEQIEVINSIIDEKAYTCSILTVKHDRKLPPGGLKGAMGNLMDNVAGSVAQQGAPDAQIQFYGKSHYSFTKEPSWLLVQSRDFGKEQIPLVSNGVSWIVPPPEMGIGDFEDYMQADYDGRGAPKKDPALSARVIAVLRTSLSPLTVKELQKLLNIASDQILRREIASLVESGRIACEKAEGKQGFLYRIAEPVSMPREGD